MLAGPKNGMAASRSRLNGPVGTGVRTRCPTVCGPLNSVLQVKSADAVAYRDFGARWVRSPAPSSCDAAPPLARNAPASQYFWLCSTALYPAASIALLRNASCGVVNSCSQAPSAAAL